MNFMRTFSSSMLGNGVGGGVVTGAGSVDCVSDAEP